MSRKIKNVDILQADNAADLAIALRAAVAAGWEMQGGVSVCVQEMDTSAPDFGVFHYTFAIAIVLYE